MIYFVVSLIGLFMFILHYYLERKLERKDEHIVYRLDLKRVPKKWHLVIICFIIIFLYIIFV